MPKKALARVPRGAGQCFFLARQDGRDIVRLECETSESVASGFQLRLGHTFTYTVVLNIIANLVPHLPKKPCYHF